MSGSGAGAGSDVGFWPWLNPSALNIGPEPSPPPGYVRIRVLRDCVLGGGLPPAGSGAVSGTMCRFSAGSVIEVLASAVPAGQNLWWLLDDTTGLPLSRTRLNIVGCVGCDRPKSWSRCLAECSWD
jgi:hypothetical protein